MYDQPLAFVSDIHAHLDALDAVLLELEHRGVRHLFVAGDTFLGEAGQSLEVWKRLQDIKAQCIRGLGDTALVSVDPNSLEPKNEEERTRFELFQETRSALGDVVLERIRRLPDQLRIPMVDGREIVMVHGAPADSSVSMTHDMEDAELMALISDDPADIVVCGASHVPFQRALDDVHVVNVGSVGEAPEGKVAHFSVISPKLSGATIEQSCVILSK